MTLAEQDELHATASQLDAMLRSVIVDQLAKLERVAAAAKAFPDFFNAQRSRADDRRAMWAFTLLDAQAINAVVQPVDADRMRADGLSEQDIEAVQDHLTWLRVNDLVPTKLHVLRPMLEAVGLPITAMNVAQAQAIFFQGMKLALAQHDRRYGANRVEEADFVAAVLKDRVPHFADNAPSAAPNTEPVDRAQTNGTNQGPKAPIDEITGYAESIIREKQSDEEWDDKTQRQARSISGLLVRYLKEEAKIGYLDDVRQSHLSDFLDFLRYDIYKFYGRSSRDAFKSIARLRADALEKSENKRGIIADTLKRHCTFLSQVFGFAAAHGAEIHERVDFSQLRPKGGKKKRARNARAKLPLEIFQAVFRAPPFINCAAWDDLNAPGLDGAALVFHCALYFVPLMIYYCGGRREEFCGLMVDDVITDNGPIPYVHIALNEQRRIKNEQSQRNVAVHPELIRLGFLEYVAAIKALGYKLLFPDLFSPTTRSPMGDRFYKQFRPILTQVGATEAGLGSHAVRHLFGAQLKKKGVSEEDRGDLLGHSGTSETSERYCESHEIKHLAEVVQKLPVVTAHLIPHSIRLLPWVEKKSPPPFSRPAKIK